MNTRPPRTSQHFMRLLVPMFAIVLATAACGDSASDPSVDKTSSRADIESGGESAKVILSEDALPEGWRYATSEDFLGIPQMCGVVLEPPELTSAITQRFANSSAAAFVIQYSFVSSDEDATKDRIDSFVAAARDCASYKPAKGEEALVSVIDDIDKVGDSFAAVHAVNANDDTDARDYVVFRIGKQVTVLLSYGIGRLATKADLEAMASSIAAKVEANGF